MLNSLANLSPLLARLTDLLTHQRTLLDNLARHDTTYRLADTPSGPSPPPSERSRDTWRSNETEPRTDSQSPPSSQAGAESDTSMDPADSSPSQHSDPDLTADPRLEALAYDPAIRGLRLGEAEAALRIERLLGVRLTRSDAGDVDFLDQDGNTYDPVGNFPGEYFDAHWPNLQNKILGHLEKADYVPVDVSRFTPEQTAKLNEFIAENRLAPRVFLVGE